MMHLDDFFHVYPRFAVAFSGGVDSAYLLYAARKAGCEIHAYFVKSQFQPEFELKDARKISEMLQIPLTMVDIDILAVPEISMNSTGRCYFCKKTLFTKLKMLALQDGYPILCDGTNASDDISDRPGMRALQELGVASPLRDAGLTKTEIRRRLQRAAIFIHNKPAYACLATRVQTGQPLTAELLARVEKAENAVAALGFTDFRVRVCEGAARLQLDATQIERAGALHHQLLCALLPLFPDVLLDLKPRTRKET